MSFGASIDQGASYDGQKTCNGTPKPGVLAFQKLILATYPCTSDFGISRACSSGGTSEHKEGRAWDWAVNYPHPAATTLLDWLIAGDEYGNTYAMARRLGIMYMIWNRKIWKSYEADRGWQSYTGDNPHTDHVHFSFSWDGAEERTTYWTDARPAQPPTNPTQIPPTSPTPNPSTPPSTTPPSTTPPSTTPPSTTPPTTIPPTTFPPGGPPRGALESASCDRLLGWAQDPSDPDNALSVRITFDQGTAPFLVVASDNRLSLCNMLGSCAHGFELLVPPSLRDGQIHFAYAYGVARNGAATMLSGSPASFRCDQTSTVPIPVVPPEGTPSQPSQPPSTDDEDTAGSAHRRITGACSIGSLGNTSAVATAPVWLLAMLLLGLRHRRRRTRT